MACDQRSDTPVDGPDFYRGNGFAVQWFNSNLLRHMDLYAESSTRRYVLVEKHECDVLTTSRVYTDLESGKRLLVPPNSWDSPLVGWRADPATTSHATNACNMFCFDTFDEFVTYVKLLYATQDGVPFFRVQRYLRDERLSNLIDADRPPPEPKRIWREKIYIS